MSTVEAVLSSCTYTAWYSSALHKQLAESELSEGERGRGGRGGERLAVGAGMCGVQVDRMATGRGVRR